MGRKKVSGLADAEYAVDVELGARFDELLADARAAENAFRNAQAAAAPNEELYLLARMLDAALTDVMRTAYAAARAEIGPCGYDDRIYRRKAKAKPAVHGWTDEAERLLTLRETHRLTGIPPVPQSGLYAGERPAQPQVPLYVPDQPEPNRLERIRQMTQATASTNLVRPGDRVAFIRNRVFIGTVAVLLGAGLALGIQTAAQWSPVSHASSVSRASSCTILRSPTEAKIEVCVVPVPVSAADDFIAAILAAFVGGILGVGTFLAGQTSVSRKEKRSGQVAVRVTRRELLENQLAMNNVLNPTPRGASPPPERIATSVFYAPDTTSGSALI